MDVIIVHPFNFCDRPPKGGPGCKYSPRKANRTRDSLEERLPTRISSLVIGRAIGYVWIYRKMPAVMYWVFHRKEREIVTSWAGRQFASEYGDCVLLDAERETLP